MNKQKVNFFVENFENFLWEEQMNFLPDKDDIISENIFGNGTKWIVIGRAYFSDNELWGILLKEIE